MTYEEFIDKASLKFNNKFTYHQETFVDHKTDMRITCPVHGDFKATPRAHLNSKYGCTECSKNSRILWTEDTVREESKKYKTKREFWKGSQKAYAIASKNKWLDSYTWITGDHKGNNYWTHDRVLEEADIELMFTNLVKRVSL